MLVLIKKMVKTLEYFSRVTYGNQVIELHKTITYLLFYNYIHFGLQALLSI